jgi:cytoskeletal protein RodZ
MKRFRHVFLVLLTALSLMAGYSFAQGTPPQPAQQQQSGDTEENDQEQNDQEQNESQEESGEANEDGTSDGETNDDMTGETSEGSEGSETSEAEEMEGSEANQAPAAIESFGSVSLQDAVAAAQKELASSNAPFEATLEKVNGQLVWMLDFVSPAKQVTVNADSGAVVSSADLANVPASDATLSDYGSLALDKVVEIAQGAYGSPADVTEMALEKDKGTLTWRIDIGGKLVVIDATSGTVISVGTLN